MSLLYLHHLGIWGGGTLSCFDVTEMLIDEHKIALSLPRGKNAAKNYADKN